mmetsp:Transcript_20750/g.36933  ORF Transcript_20750/g.36933 Transcript_20750/m.36933 type:complete len:312 (-) Transcript_20750:82-1017(-)
MSDTMRFCTMGTLCGESSTPKSPRATITASTSSEMRSRSATALGFSIFAIIFTAPLSPPVSPRRSRSSTMSSALCTNERAIQSTSILTPNSASFLSFSVNAEIGSVASGTFTPLRSESFPATTTSVSAKSLPHRMTCSLTLPSSRRRVVLGVIAAKISGCGRVTRVVSPGWSFMSRVNFEPFSRKTGPSLNVPTRSFGPWRSSRMAVEHRKLASSFRMFSITLRWVSWEPWERLTRKTSTPAFHSFSIISYDWELGPIVATIFVLEKGPGNLEGLILFFREADSSGRPGRAVELKVRIIRMGMKPLLQAGR